MPVVRLTVRVLRVEGQFAAECQELGIVTCSETMDGLQVRIVDMIGCYFDACRKLGTYERVISKLTGGGSYTVAKAQVTVKADVATEHEILL